MKIERNPCPQYCDYSSLREAEEQGYDVTDSWSLYYAYQCSYEKRLMSFSQPYEFPWILQAREDFARYGFRYQGKT